MGYKVRRVIYATHALKRAKQRGISRQDILDVLEAADVSIRQRPIRVAASCENGSQSRMRLVWS